MNDPYEFYNSTIYNTTFCEIGNWGIPQQLDCELTECFHTNRSWEDLQVSIPSHQTGLAPNTTLEIELKSVYTNPKVDLSKNGISLDSTLEVQIGMDYRYVYNLTDYGEYVLIVSVPGYLDTFTYHYEILEEQSSINVLAITLGTVIPICILLSIAISVFFCYKKRLFCFRDHTLFTPEVSAPNNEYSTSPNVAGQSNETFYEIDLTDSPEGTTSAATAPMSSYIQKVTAR